MMVGHARAASGVKRVGGIADDVTRQREHALVNDDDGDFAVRNRFAAMVGDGNIDLCLATGRERFIDRIGRDS
jgi:hypothetical protein